MNRCGTWKATTDLCAGSSIPWPLYSQRSAAHFSLNHITAFNIQSKTPITDIHLSDPVVSSKGKKKYVALHTLTLRLFVLWQILVAPKQKQVVQPLGLAGSR